MMRRRFLALSCSVALATPLALVVTPSASGAGIAFSQAQNASQMANKKGKKKGKTTAKVNASWTVSASSELNGGTESEKIEISITNGKVTFDDENDTRADGEADVRITYQGHYLTDNRSWAIGCDTEERTTTATFIDKAPIGVYATNTRTVNGKSERLPNGWGLSVDRPVVQLMRSMVTTGFFLEWESLLQDKCNTVPISDPLGWWSPSFVTSYSATGKLNGGGKGVLLTEPFSNHDQVGAMVGKGTIEFSESVEKRGARSGRGPLN